MAETARPSVPVDGAASAGGTSRAEAAASAQRPVAITRRELELVIRRAAELYAAEAEAEDRLTEAEVLRIAEELGLPDRHVRRALYDLPAGRTGAAGLLDRWYGEPRVSSTRVVPGAPDHVLRRLEDYLVTRELLQVVRQQGGKAAFAPAEDAISNVARAVRRPQRQWQIARARRVYVDVRPMPEQDSHVRIELDVGHHRSRALRNGILGGSLVGLPLAAAAFFPMGQLVYPVAGDAAAVAAGVAAGATTFAATVAAGTKVARNRFAARINDARQEMASLLDRLELGARLDPPPAPWLRSLRSRIAGTLRPAGRG